MRSFPDTSKISCSSGHGQPWRLSTSPSFWMSNSLLVTGVGSRASTQASHAVCSGVFTAEAWVVSSGRAVLVMDVEALDVTLGVAVLRFLAILRMRTPSES